MVRLGRLERPTSCFGGTRSIQLSYSRVAPLYHAGLLQCIPPFNLRSVLDSKFSNESLQEVGASEFA